jgi:hypothetical protein
MSQEIKIAFTASEYKYYYDSIRIHTEGQDLLIPLHGYPLLNRVEFPTLISFGNRPLCEPAKKVSSAFSSPSHKLPRLSLCVARSPSTFPSPLKSFSRTPTFSLHLCMGSFRLMAQWRSASPSTRLPSEPAPLLFASSWPNTILNRSKQSSMRGQSLG